MSDKPEEIVIKKSRVSSLIAVLAFAAAAGAGVYGYLELSRVNTTLAHMVTQLHHQVAANQQTITALQESVTGVKDNSALSAEQQKLMAEWVAAQQGDLNKWHVSEAQYLTRLAGHQLELTRDAASAEILLQHASEILQKINNPAVEPVRQALAENISSLQSQPQVNTEQLYLQMATIYNLLDNLPLPSTPLQNTEDPNQQEKHYGDAPWWKVTWHKSMDALKKIVIVRYDGSKDMPLILPEEKMFLYQNLHAQMEEAMLSVLNHNPAAYQASLQHAIDWVQKYFVQDAEVTTKVLTELKTLQAINLQPPTVNIAATMQAFDQYLAQNEQPQPAAVTH
jgi:uroporphyrin-3 C-methyltransferase